MGLISLGVTSLVYGFSEAGRMGNFTDGTVLACVLVSVVLLVSYVARALRMRGTPVIDVRLFGVRSFSAASTLLFLMSGTLFGAMFLLPLYYQELRGASVFQAGLMLAPQGLGMALSMFYVGKVIDRSGAERTVTMVGILLAIVGFAPYALGAAHTSQVVLGVALFISGLGIGTVPLAAMTSTYRGLEPHQIAPATSVSRIIQQIGGTVGVAAFAVLLQSGSTGIAQLSPGAFDRAFRLSLCLTAFAIVPALLLPRAPSAASDQK